MSYHTDHPHFDQGGYSTWNSDEDVTRFFDKNDKQVINPDSDWKDKAQGFLDIYLGKSNKYQDEAESSVDTQKKAEDFAKGTAAGWGTHELGSNFTALTPPVMGGGGQDQPFVIGGAAGPQQPGTGQRIAGTAMGALSGAKAGSMIMPGIGTAIGAAIGGLGSWFCDERLKTDIAPLEKVDVHDELAEVAFLVKEIRECA